MEDAGGGNDGKPGGISGHVGSGSGGAGSGGVAGSTGNGGAGGGGATGQGGTPGSVGRDAAVSTDAPPRLDAPTAPDSRSSQDAPSPVKDSASLPDAFVPVTARSPGCGKPVPTLGRLQNQTVAVGDKQRSYVVALPSTYDPNEALALVFVFHGLTGMASNEYTYWSMEEAVAPQGQKGQAIIAYPDGLARSETGNMTGWNLDPAGDDVAYFDQLTKKLSDTYCLDTRRIFVTGFSFGGYMSNLLGCIRGDVLRAVAPMSGAGPMTDTHKASLSSVTVAPDTTIPCKGDVAVMVTHGRDDGDVLFANGKASRDYWIAANGCAATSSPAPNLTPCVAYDTCKPGRPVLWCELPGGHENKGNQPGQSNRTWAFFNSLPIP